MSKIYHKKDFQKILERERVRTDRTGHEFSIVVFEIVDSKDYESLIQYLSYVLSQRVRCYDEIGWITEQRLGVILPDTLAEGAQKLADDICSLIIPKALHPKYSIFTYPSNWINGSQGERSESDEPPASNHLNLKPKPGQNKPNFFEELKPLFLKPLPLYKRIMDVVVACLGSVIVSPLLLLMAVFIKMVSPGPILFKQQRVGYLGKPFTCWKFRTMKINASTAVHQKHVRDFIHNGHSMNKLDDQDPRIIPLGKYIRKAGLDELPQLINVIRGEMSLIGPRPCIPYEARQYRTWHHKRFETVPGLTGLWQVNGKNRTTLNEMMRLDIHYGKKQSVWLDLKILLKTLPAIITQLTR